VDKLRDPSRGASTDYADYTDRKRLGLGEESMPLERNQSGSSVKSGSSVEKVRDPQTYEIIGAAMEVHGLLGCGFHEPVYQEALAREFTLRGIPFRREVELAILYKGEPLDVAYKPDFICYESVIVELKALEKISGKEQSQVINYLKATSVERALLFNFGTIHLEYHRLILGFKHQWEKIPERRD
jgi:GxxExxY protein